MSTVYNIKITHALHTDENPRIIKKRRVFHYEKEAEEYFLKTLVNEYPDCYCTMEADKISFWSMPSNMSRDYYRVGNGLMSREEFKERWNEEY